MNKLSIFGFTGSIGSQALDLLEGKDEYDYHIFICNKNIEKAEYVLEKFKPKYLFFSDQSASQKFNSKKFPSTNLILSKEELLKVIHDEPSDVYLSAISSFEMIDVTYLLAKSGKKILLANKESLVIFGSVIMDEAQINNTKIIPIDSEHYSIYHSLKNTKIQNIKKIFLMASGGPFHGVALEDAIQKSPDEALNHPNWDMGKKITIDSASLVNKCFEVIEAHHLFGVDFSKLGILIEPKSLIHSMVEFIDGSFEAQISAPSMSFPLSYGLFNERSKMLYEKFSFDISSSITELSISPFPDDRKFLLEITEDVISKGQNRGLIFAAVNDFAVKKFLKKEINFGDIYNLIRDKYDYFEKQEITTIEMLKANTTEIQKTLKLAK
jgi:1-deoxy-D-xylulose-5-phosphate reductoisomerase